ncbi:MAG: prolyl oligopeptidase family serine peptidase [Opitutaceae bacterium]|nr:prolyl oligopeptidase family serine peptidase [Opitutaceae bacterium]
MRHLFLAGAVIAAPLAAVAAEGQTSRAFESKVTKTVSYRYLQALPRDYDSAADRRWPLLLFLHGAGERGSDLQRVTKHGPAKLLERGAGLSPAEAAVVPRLADNFIVISPQCPADTVWDDDAVLALLDRARAELRVDPARIYLTGLSMGGYGTWSVGLKHPERFAAIVPICGGGTLISVLLSDPSRKAALQSLGIWAFHGAKDPTVPLSESERLVALLRRGGVKDIQLTTYPEAKHDSWTETYANPELYAWLLRHERLSGPGAK